MCGEHSCLQLAMESHGTFPQSVEMDALSIIGKHTLRLRVRVLISYTLRTCNTRLGRLPHWRCRTRYGDPIYLRGCPWSAAPVDKLQAASKRPRHNKVRIYGYQQSGVPLVLDGGEALPLLATTAPLQAQVFYLRVHQSGRRPGFAATILPYVIILWDRHPSARKTILDRSPRLKTKPHNATLPFVARSVARTGFSRLTMPSACFAPRQGCPICCCACLCPLACYFVSSRSRPYPRTDANLKKTLLGIIRLTRYSFIGQFMEKQLITSHWSIYPRGSRPLSTGCFWCFSKFASFPAGSQTF